MKQELIQSEKISTPKKGGQEKIKRILSVEKKTISISKDDHESIELINSILDRCNSSDIGRKVTVSDIALYAIRKLKDSDLDQIRESTLTMEEKAMKSLAEYNQKHGTNLTLIELAIKQLKKEKKENLQ